MLIQKYLEDLQQNNPAEYELLVQELQAKNGNKGGKAGQPLVKVVVVDASFDNT